MTSARNADNSDSFSIFFPDMVGINKLLIRFTAEQVAEEIERRKANLQFSLDKMLKRDVSLLEKKELSRIYGGLIGDC